MRISIIIPAFREEATIAEVLRRVSGVDLSALGVEKEIVVCDDGSTDRTASEIQRAAEQQGGIRLVRHARNQGKGAAIRTALRHATGEYVLIQDADLEYDVDDYPAMIRLALDGADVVYGSRFLVRRWPDGMQPANFVANRMLTVAANALYGVGITDEATCFKLVRTDLLRSLNLRCERFEFCPEVTAKLGLRHVRIAEAPVRYHARSIQGGKKVRWTDGIEALWVLVRTRLGR